MIDMKEFDFSKTTITDIIDEIINDCINTNNDEIIFEPTSNSLNIIFKNSFNSKKYSFVPKDYSRNMVSRIKMLANLNIMETRKEQEGNIINDKGEFHVLITPENDGEKVIINLK